MTRYLEEIDVILERCLTEIQSGRMTVAECLVTYPDYHPDLESLLNLSTRLMTGHEITASPAFRERALARFHSMSGPSQQAIVSPYPTQNPIAPIGNPSPGRLASKPAIIPKIQRSNFSFSFRTLALILVVLSLFTFSIAFAANQSRPGSAIYPIKIAIEQVELQLSTSKIGDQQLHLEFAARRLAEVDLLLQDGRSYLIDVAIANYSGHLASIRLLLNSDGITEQERLQIAEKILNHQGLNEASLEVLSLRISPEQRATIIAAIQSAQDARDQAAQVINRLPDIRDQIRQRLISTVAAPSATPTISDNFVGVMVSATATPTPNSLRGLPPTDDWLADLPEDLPSWLENTPDWSNLATAYPSIYPTLAEFATRYPDIRSTPRPYVIPTRVRPPQINPLRQAPTVWPTPPVIPPWNH